MKENYKLNWFTPRITSEENYSVKLPSRIHDIIFRRFYYKFIANPIKYDIIWPLIYKQKHYKENKQIVQKKEKMKYTLLDIKAPEIMSGVIVKTKEPGVGGIKLTYSKSKEYSLLSETSKVIFLKPYKEVWEARGKKFCKKGEWGNTNTPLSNVWLEVYEDYANYEEYMKKNPCLLYEKVTDPKIIKQLNLRSKTFSIDEPTDKPTTHLSIKIRLWLNECVFNPIKDRIFNNNQKTN
jgi:hypothetical protein